MSLPRFSVLMLSLSVAIAGCSSFPKKKNDLKDTGPQRSEQAYYESAQKSLKRGQYTEANKSLEALDTYYPTGAFTEQAQLDLMYSFSSSLSLLSLNLFNRRSSVRKLLGIFLVLC